MAEIRILLMHLPRLLQEVARAILETQPDILVVAEMTGDLNDLTTILTAKHADVVVCGIDSPAVATLLRLRPAMSIILISTDGRDGLLCQPTGELSTETLLAAVRTAAS